MPFALEDEAQGHDVRRPRWSDKSSGELAFGALTEKSLVKCSRTVALRHCKSQGRLERCGSLKAMMHPFAGKGVMRFG